jgi:SAM-dependent methyltransferase
MLVTWKPEGVQGKETAKTRWRAVPYTRGKGLDLGCGNEKLWDTKNVIGIDSCKDAELFGHIINPEIKMDVESLSIFGSATVDFVFSSHVLEHFEYRKVPDILREWFRVVKVGGYVVLYLPDEDQYPKCGEPERGILLSEQYANSDHKWNVNYDRVVAAAEKACPAWDLVAFERCEADDEYSLFFAFKKLKWN